MAFAITTAFVQQFKDNIFPLAQQSTSRFRGKVMEDIIVGESGYLEQLAPQDAVQATTRHSDTPILNSEHLRRRISLGDWDWGDLIDKEDKVRMLIDPQSAYALNARRAMARATDKVIAGAFFSTAFTGKDGSTSVSWPTGPGGDIPAGKQVAVNSWKYGNGSGTSHLTISKLIEARVNLLGAEAIDDQGGSNLGGGDEELFFGCGSIQIGDLLATTEATSADFNQVRALVNGEIDKYMGFTFVRYEGMPLTTDGNLYRRCAAWSKSGMGLGVGQDVQVEIAQRPDKRWAWQVYASMALGAARLEEAKVCEVLCSEA